MTNLLYELSFVLTAAAGIFSLFSAEITGETAGLIPVIIQLLIAGIFVLFRKSRWTGRLVIISVVIAFIIAVFFLSKNESMLEFFRSHSGYLWLPVIGAAAFLIGELMGISRLLRIIVSLAATGWLIAGTALGFGIEKLFVVAVIFILLLTVTQEVQRRWKKQGETDPTKHVAFLLPFILLSAVLVAVSPAPEEPYDWAFAKKIAAVVTDICEMIADQAAVDPIGAVLDPAEAMMGFSDKGGIAGRLSGGDREVLVISGLSSYVDQLRLSGKTFNTFDGREWTDTDTSTAPSVMIDTIATWASLNTYSHHVVDYAHKMYIDVKYRRMHTDRVFLPPKAILTSAGMRTEEYRESGGDVLWPETKSLNSSYSLSYYALNRDQEGFDHYLNSASVPDRESYETAERRINYDRTPGCGYEDYLNYVAEVGKNYSQAPTLSPKLRAYMDRVYEGAETASEKLKRLESMLREFEYSTSPGVLPERIKNASDFLDYFVLESRKGFCSHFATAFVLLARAEGLPARYVQGFLTQTGGGTGATVRSAEAHAWPEVYYEGAGWISYEPTPAYGAVDSYGKTVKEKKEEHQYGTEEEPEEGEETEEESENRSKISFPFRWYMIVIPIAAGLLCIILILLIGKLIAAGRFRAMGEEDKLVALCRRNLRILRLAGLAMEDGETLNEYRNRLREEGVEDCIFLEELEKYLYRGAPSGDAVRIATEEKKALLLVLKKKSRIRYLRYRLL